MSKINVTGKTEAELRDLAAKHGYSALWVQHVLACREQKADKIKKLDEARAARKAIP